MKKIIITLSILCFATISFSQPPRYRLFTIDDSKAKVIRICKTRYKGYYKTMKKGDKTIHYLHMSRNKKIIFHWVRNKLSHIEINLGKVTYKKYLKLVRDYMRIYGDPNRISNYNKKHQIIWDFKEGKYNAFGISFIMDEKKNLIIYYQRYF